MAGCETWICESCQGIWNHSFSPTCLMSSFLQVMLCLNNCEQLEANLNGWFVFTAATNELTSWKADTVIFSPSCCSLAVFARWIFCCGLIRNFSCALLTRLQRGRRMVCALAWSYHQLSRVQFSSAKEPTLVCSRNIYHGYTLYFYSLIYRKVRCTCCALRVNWPATATQISSQHPFYPLKGRWRSEQPHSFLQTWQYAPNAAQSGQWLISVLSRWHPHPSRSSKNLENLLHNNCHLPPKAIIWGILLLQVNERATGQTIFAHKEEHSLFGRLKQWAVGNPGIQTGGWNGNLLPITLDGVSIHVSSSGEFLLAVKCISLRAYQMLPQEQQSHCFHLHGQMFTRSLQPFLRSCWNWASLDTLAMGLWSCWVPHSTFFLGIAGSDLCFGWGFAAGALRQPLWAVGWCTGKMLSTFLLYCSQPASLCL